MKDQYDNEIPNDLVLVYENINLTPKQITMIDNADWYVVDLYHYKGLLCVSAKAVDYLFDGNPVQEFNSKIKSVQYITKILHRYTEQDGFYYA